MNSDRIRESFLSFFKAKKHKIVPSSSLIPHGDTTLLLTTAGMVQMKPYFLGIDTPPSKRLTSCQKCFRTTDIDTVGDAKHLTFFEMLGNFSIGDYFKKEAIAWGWEFVTNSLNIAPDHLWVTIFLDDNEAFNHWREIGIPASRIVRLGEKDNFWGPAGDSGPCGPCSEIHYDFGIHMGCNKPDCGPACDCSRFSEIWNLVFMEYNQDSNGIRTKLSKPNIDTGMGLERVAAVMQGVSSVYDTDLFLPLRNKICSLANIKYGTDDITDAAVRIVAEHCRGITFLIADRILPSNEGRGYVLRRILRRASFFGRTLGINDKFVDKVCSVVIEKMGHIYTELTKNESRIMQIVKNEEEKFIYTLDAGIILAESSTEEAIKKGMPFLTGEEVFRLWDTYGFPAELTADIARRKGLDIDSRGFETELAKQRERARAGHKFTQIISPPSVESVETTPAPAVLSTSFVGYDKIQAMSKVSCILLDHDSKRAVKSASKGQKVAIMIDETPFYGEMGGQVGDTGRIVGPNGEVRVTDVVRDSEGRIIHRGEVENGIVYEGDNVEAIVDSNRRQDIARNHTATHLLQAALIKVLGDTIEQRGSLVTAERLRFDFSHLTPISKQQLYEVQYLVNEWIRDNKQVLSAKDVSYRKAINDGAIALFDEKYGDRVRVIKVGNPPISFELCGGTHVKATGEIGLFLLVSESSIGSGLRRIEALTGRGAYNLLEKRLMDLEKIAEEVRSTVDEVPRKIGVVLDELSNQRKRLAALERRQSRDTVDSLLPEVEKINGVSVLTKKMPDKSIPVLRDMADTLRNKLGSVIVVFATSIERKPQFVVSVTPDLVEKGFHAGEIVKRVAEVTGGRGGGKATMAQAGGIDKDKIDEALELVGQLIRRGS